jgi:LPS sulfotransferase NodH
MNLRRVALYHLVRSQPPRRPPTRGSGGVTAVQSLRRIPAAASYVICTNPRSGSVLLSNALASTSVAGNPREWFNASEEQRHRALWRMDHSTDLSFPDYLRLAKAESATPNGISGIKIHYYQFAELPKRMEAIDGLRGLTAAQLLSRLFPQARYLWLRRRDKARQAISLHIACSTNEWWATDGAALDECEGNGRDPAFDPHVVAGIEAVLVKRDSEWQSYFGDNNIAPFVVYYEDLAADYQGTIASVLKWLGVPGADAIVVPRSRFKRQSNERNEEWLARYTAFKGERGDLAQSPASVGSGVLTFEGVEKPFDSIPNVWKRWVAQNKLLKTKDDAIVEVLVDNGYSRAAALAEVGRAASAPYLLGAALTQHRLSKGASLLNAMAQLARLDAKANTVERRTILSRDEFRDRYYAANRPVIIQGLMAGWRAMTAWTPDYLKSAAGDRTIEVMTGRNADAKYELNPRKHRTALRFADYIDMVYSGKVTNDYYMVANNLFFQRLEAQPLLQDFAAFPEYLNPAAVARQCFFWFGPAGTVTPLHHDTSNILIAQVAGRKRYRLVPASQWQCVYNSTGVFSDVDCENPDLSRHPKFGDASVIDVVLEPGEVLFMPVGWWHHVRALEVSMTVSFTNFVFPNNFTWEELS